MFEPRTVFLDDPVPLLEWIERRPDDEFRLDAVDVIQPWGIVALAALAREDGPKPLKVARSVASASSVRFAHAIGFEEVLRNQPSGGTQEAERTVKLRRFRTSADIEPLSRETSTLLMPGREHSETRRTIEYVLIELLRNVVQHSGDPLGGVAGAQRMDQGGTYATRACIQVTVSDCGVGIPEALKRMHRVKTPQEALEKSIWPHISGTFPEGFTGSLENAGMGLFFIAEMAKLTAGSLIISSRGATLRLKGDAEGKGRHEIEFLDHRRIGFPGTLVIFELPVGEVRDYDALIETIQQRAMKRTPRRVTYHWFKYDDAPSGAFRCMVSVASEDTEKAKGFAQEHLVPRIVKREPVLLDFTNIEVCTQSFVHALLFEAVRVAWALRSPIYIANAARAVKSTLDLLERYALRG